eukprot:366343-Chlamydomonas_euryale.AAC.8
MHVDAHVCVHACICHCANPVYAVRMWGLSSPLDPHVKPWQRRPRTGHACFGLRSQPITPASASAGPRPQTCMHVHAPRPPASGHLCACACIRRRAGLGVDRLDRPRPTASTNFLCTDHTASVSH